VAVLRRQAQRPGADPVQQAIEAGVDEGQPGVLATIGDFLSRPGYAIRSALRGRLDDMVENSAQFFLDLPTGGWLNKEWSLANLFSPTGDITDKDERPEFTDLVGKTGNPAVDLGIDVVGGMVTDPLTYLPFAGQAKLAGGALMGVRRGVAGARAAAGLMETAEGAAKLGQASRLVAAELTNPASRIPALSELKEAFGREFLDAGALSGPNAALEAGHVLQRLQPLGTAVTPEWIASDAAVTALGGGQVGARRASALRQYVETRAAEAVVGEAGFGAVPTAAGMQGPMIGRRPAAAVAARRFSEIATERFRELGKPHTSQGVLANLTPAQLQPYKQALPAVWNQARREAQILTGFDETGMLKRFGATALGGDPLKAGLAAIEEGGMLVPDGALLFKIPFDPRKVGSAGLLAPRALTGAGAFGKSARALIPGKLAADLVVEKSGSGLAVDAIQWTNQKAIDLFESAKGKFHAKELPIGEEALLSQGGIDARKAAAALGVRHLTVGLKAMERAAGRPGVPGAVLRQHGDALGQAWIEAGDTFEDIVQAAAVPHPGQRRARLGAIEAQLDADLAGAGVPGQTMNLPAAMTAGYSPDQVRLMGKLGLLAQERAVANAATVGLGRAPAIRAIGEFVADMDRMSGDLVREGVWEKKLPNPFYAPFQAKKDVAAFLSAKPSHALNRRTLDVFTQQRVHRKSPEMEKLFQDVAARFHLPAPAQLQETNLFDLWAKRRAAHAQTMENVALRKTLEEKFPGARYTTAVEKYIDRQFAEIGERKGLAWVLGGGRYMRKLAGKTMSDAEPAEALARGLKVVPHPEGGLAVEKRWEGLNFYAKAALTLPFPAHHVRNVFSMIGSVLTEPDMGAPVARQLIAGFRDAPIIQALTDNALTRAVGVRPHTPDSAALVARAIADPNALTPAQVAQLDAATIGRLPARDVVRMIREGGVVRSSFHHNEVFEAPLGIGRMFDAIESPEQYEVLERLLQGKALVSQNAPLLDKIGAAISQVRNPPASLVQSAVLGKGHAAVQTARNQVLRPFGALASWIEDTNRIGAFVRLIERGVTPAEAIRKIDRVFVNYAINSGAERTLRDFVPFARYSLGSVPVTLQNALRRPGAALPAAVRTIVNRQDETQFLPENLRGQTAIQAGVDREGNPVYVSSLGLPYDPAMDALGLVGRPFSGGATRFAASLQPQVRALAEGALGKSFFFGGDPFAYRKAPRILPDALTTVTTLPSGQKIREIPGWVNHWLLGAGPLSRFRSESDNVLDDRLDLMVRGVDSLSGVRLQSVDQKVQARKAIIRWLEERETAGEVGKIEAFFTRGEGDEKLDQAIKALDSLRKGDQKKRAPKPAPGVR
jgi:hypothetical protein